MEFSLVDNTTPNTQPPEPPPPPLPPENPKPYNQTTSDPPKEQNYPKNNQTVPDHDQWPKKNNLPHYQTNKEQETLEHDTGKVDSRQQGNYVADLPFQSYKAKLLNESRHIYFPTWFDSLEMEKEHEEEECETRNTSRAPEICFTKEEIAQFRKPWKKSLIVQTVSYLKPIPDIGIRLQKNLENGETTRNYGNRTRILHYQVH